MQSGDANRNEDDQKPTLDEYDVLNRAVKVTLPDESVTETVYGFAASAAIETETTSSAQRVLMQRLKWSSHSLN